MSSASIAVSVTSEDLAHLAKILSQEEDGKKLRRELASTLRKASEPARDAARSAILSMDSGGLPHEGEPLRQAIADRIVAQARLSGRSTGATVRAKRLKTGFIHAPRRTNAPKWRHPVFKRVTSKGAEIDVWVDQIGKPRWFDDEMDKNRQRWRDGVEEAMNSMAERIARKA